MSVALFGALLGNTAAYFFAGVSLISSTIGTGIGALVGIYVYESFFNSTDDDHPVHHATPHDRTQESSARASPRRALAPRSEGPNTKPPAGEEDDSWARLAASSDEDYARISGNIQNMIDGCSRDTDFHGQPPQLELTEMLWAAVAGLGLFGVPLIFVVFIACAIVAAVTHKKVSDSQLLSLVFAPLIIGIIGGLCAEVKDHVDRVRDYWRRQHNLRKSTNDLRASLERSMSILRAARDDYIAASRRK